MKTNSLLGKKLAECTNSLAKATVIRSANSTCVWLAHQPQFPKEAECYSKTTKKEERRKKKDRECSK